MFTDRDSTRGNRFRLSVYPFTLLSSQPTDFYLMFCMCVGHYAWLAGIESWNRRSNS